MPDAIITSTASTFGTITGTFAADQSTITGTVSGVITGTLDGSVGVPGVGVPDGGTTGQVLQKATNTSYDTVWATPSGGAWGTITGTLSNQTDLQTALNLKAPLASPSLTGVPTAPTAATLTSTTQLATTAFVQQELLSGTANARNLEVYVRNQTGATLTAGTIVYINGATGNRPTVTKAQANNDANSAQTFGFVKTSIANNGFGFVIVRGELENVDTSALTEGVQLYLSPTTAGTWTTTKPSAPQHLVYVGICVRAHPTQGVILVAVQNGYELNELHDVQITSPTNGQVLKYNSSTSLWYNGLDVGIPVGGTAGQYLQKIDGTNYNTDWVTINLSAYAVKANNLSDLASASTARTNLGLGTMAVATAADYSTTTVANGLYYPLTGNPSSFLTAAALSPYLTSATAASTYQTLSGMSSYLTTSAAASTYQTLSGMSSYLTTSTAASTYATKASPTFTGLSTFNNPGNYAITLDNSVGNYTSISSGVYSIYASTVEVIRLSASGIKYPDGVTQDVAYPGSSGFLLKADNLSGLANTGTARTNLGLGTMAVETASNYLTTATAASTYQTISGMSSYLTTASAASTYFTIASAANKADLASPTFTGTPTLPTGTIATTQTAGNNTTAVATTAFVTAAVPAFATTSQALDLTSNSVAISPLALSKAIMHPGFKKYSMFAGNAVGSTSGTGSSNYFASHWIENVGPSSGATGYAIATPSNVAGFDAIGRNGEPNVNFSKKVLFSGKFSQAAASGYLGDANNYWLCTLGKASAYAGNLTGRGIGIRKFGSTANFFLVVHDGTTLTAVDSGVNNNSYSATTDFLIYSDGAGNVTLWIDDTQVATTSAGPTGTATNGARIYCEVNQAGTFGARIGAHTSNLSVFISP